MSDDDLETDDLEVAMKTKAMKASKRQPMMWLTTAATTARLP